MSMMALPPPPHPPPPPSPGKGGEGAGRRGTVTTDVLTAPVNGLHDDGRRRCARPSARRRAGRAYQAARRTEHAAAGGSGAPPPTHPRLCALPRAPPPLGWSGGEHPRGPPARMASDPLPHTATGSRSAYTGRGTAQAPPPQQSGTQPPPPQQSGTHPPPPPPAHRWQRRGRASTPGVAGPPPSVRRRGGRGSPAPPPPITLHTSPHTGVFTAVAGGGGGEAG